MPIDDDMMIHTGQPRTVRECLEEARRATSPAETVQHLFLAVSYQQQQIEQLELAQADLGEPTQRAREGIAVRARRFLDDQMRGRLGL